MHTILSISTGLFLLAGNLFAQESTGDFEKNWHQWRGPSATGVAPTGDPPVEWSEEKNVMWKAEMPGIGHATPIIWEDQMILLSAVQTDREIKPEESAEGEEQNSWMKPVKTNFIHEFVVFSVSRKNGTINWKTTVREELPNSHTHEFGSWASNSPVTDGTHIYAYFGSQGLYCLDMNGKIIWERDFGHLQKVRSFGEGSSPVLAGDRLILVRDHEGPSSLYVLDKKTGKDILEIKRDEITSWPTPYLMEVEGRTRSLQVPPTKYEVMISKVVRSFGNAAA